MVMVAAHAHWTERQGLRRWMLASSLVLGLIIVFAFMHSGARGAAVCEEHGSGAVEPTLSVWPPGARCIGGTLDVEITRFDPSFLVLAPTIYFALCFAGWLVGRILRRDPRAH
jgi:hypothetical protein